MEHHCWYVHGMPEAVGQTWERATPQIYNAVTQLWHNSLQQTANTLKTISIYSPCLLSAVMLPFEQANVSESTVSTELSKLTRLWLIKLSEARVKSDQIL